MKEVFEKEEAFKNYKVLEKEEAFKNDEVLEKEEAFHSVLFPILGLPLFGRRKNYHQLPTLFWLEMIHMMGLSTVIKKKSVGKCGKACFSTFVCFPF